MTAFPRSLPGEHALLHFRGAGMVPSFFQGGAVRRGCDGRGWLRTYLEQGVLLACRDRVDPNPSVRAFARPPSLSQGKDPPATREFHVVKMTCPPPKA